MSLPQTLPEAIAQAQRATQQAIAQGETRLLVELWLPEVKPMPLVREFLQAFVGWGTAGSVDLPQGSTADDRAGAHHRH